MTPLLAICTPLSPPENRFHQYRYASMRSRTQFRRRRDICFPCFTRNLVNTRICLYLVSSHPGLCSSMSVGWLFLISG